MLPATHEYRDPEFQQVSLTEALDVLSRFKEAEAKELDDATTDNRHKASQFIKVILRTTPTMNKTGNTFFGKIAKVSVANYAVNWDAGSVMANQQAKLSRAKQRKLTDAQTTMFARKWGVKVEDADDSVAPLLLVSIGINDADNSPNLYLQLFVNTKNKPTAVWYEWTQGTKTGQTLSDDDMVKLKPWLKDTEKELATLRLRSGVENPIVPHSPHVQSLSEFKVNGVFYVITDHTLPAIPDNVRALAIEDVEARRKEREISKALLEEASKAEKEMLKGVDNPTDEQKTAACLTATQARMDKLIEQKIVKPEHRDVKIRQYMEQRGFWEKTHHTAIDKAREAKTAGASKVVEQPDGYTKETAKTEK